MRMSGYTNPMRQFERPLQPEFASREFRDPGLSGLGGAFSLRHTMPHLMMRHLQSGGLLDPTGQLYAASRPNLYNPDPLHRRVLALQEQMQGQFRNPAMRALPYSTTSLPYAEGGRAADPESLEEPDQDLSPEDQPLKQVVNEAILAMEGRHPDPEQAIERFVRIFGESALEDLKQMVAEDKAKAGQEDEEEEEPEESEPAEPSEEEEEESAVGGLLRGGGTGQSDEIEGNTPSGRKVLLSDGEYVIDAPTVAALGDGSTDAGARRLDDMRKEIRRASYGTDKQAKPMKKGGQAIVVRVGRAR